MQRQTLIAVEEAFEAHQHSNEESNVWRFATAQLSLLYGRVFQEMRYEKQDFFFANIVLFQRISVSFLCIPSCKIRRMAAMFALSCFLQHLFRLVEHHLSFRDTMFWSSTGILHSDKARQ